MAVTSLTSTGRLSQDNLSRSSAEGSLLPFLIGLGSVTQIRVIGALGISELILLPMALFAVFQRPRALSRHPMPVLLMIAFGWLLSAIATDLYRGTEMTNSLKGAGNIALWICCLIAMCIVLSENPTRIRSFSVGVFFSSVIALYYFRPSSLESLLAAQEEETLSFRSAYVGVLSYGMVAVSLLLSRRTSLLCAGLLLGGVVCFLNGSRSVGLSFCSAGAVLPLLINYSKQGHRQLARGTWLALPLLVIMGGLVSYGYSQAASTGLLGEGEQDRYLAQSQSKIGILQGRSEFASAILAIADSPILGHGSFVRDTNEYRLKGAELLGITPHPTIVAKCHEMNIPGHSHIWGFWIWHGLLGAVFWIYVLLFVVKFIKKYMLLEPEYLPFLLLICLGFCWSILFSPFGSRPIAAANLVFLILIYQKHRSSTSQPEPRHGTLSTWRSQ